MDGIMNIVYAILVLGIMGAVFGGLLAFAAKIFHVEQDPRIEEVRAALAGANCGGCGFAGCDAYAAAVVAGEAPPTSAPREARPRPRRSRPSWGSTRSPRPSTSPLYPAPAVRVLRRSSSITKVRRTAPRRCASATRLEAVSIFLHRPRQLRQGLPVRRDAHRKRRRRRGQGKVRGLYGLLRRLPEEDHPQGAV